MPRYRALIRPMWASSPSTDEHREQKRTEGHRHDPDHHLKSCRIQVSCERIALTLTRRIRVQCESFNLKPLRRIQVQCEALYLETGETDVDEGADPSNKVDLSS